MFGYWNLPLWNNHRLVSHTPKIANKDMVNNEIHTEEELGLNVCLWEWKNILVQRIGCSTRVTLFMDIGSTLQTEEGSGHIAIVILIKDFKLEQSATYWLKQNIRNRKWKWTQNSQSQTMTPALISMTTRRKGETQTRHKPILQNTTLWSQGSWNDWPQPFKVRVSLKAFTELFQYKCLCWHAENSKLI